MTYTYPALYAQEAVKPPTTTPNVQMHNDVVAMLEWMDSQYVSPEMQATMKRLRAVVGTRAI